MEETAKARIGSIVAGALFSLVASAALALPPNIAEVVFVRKDCSTFYAPTYCVQTMADVNAWLPTRSPADNPVLVDIGPGDWDFFSCFNQNNIALRGAGRDTTRVVRNIDADSGAMEINGCAGLTVENLTVHGSFAGVKWQGLGSSTWSNTDIFAGGAEFSQGTIFSIGWYDVAPVLGTIHYFFGSRVRALGTAGFNYGFLARDAEHWFFGGEILATSETDQNTSQTALLVDNAADFRVFGTAIRSTVGAAVTSTIFAPLPGVSGGMHGVLVQENGVFHAHGAIISVSADGSSDVNSATGLQVLGTDAHAHTPDAAFFVSTGPTGLANRLIGDGSDLQSPFLWQQGTEPPRAQHDNPSSGFLQSIRGADLFVETDCTTTSCTGVGTVPRLMIYRPECTSPTRGPWWDARANACR